MVILHEHGVSVHDRGNKKVQQNTLSSVFQFVANSFKAPVPRTRETNDCQPKRERMWQER